MVNLISKTIKQYQVLLKIRESSTTVLYKAYDQNLERYVALEVLKPSSINNEDLFEELKPSVKKNTILSHTSIGSILDFFIDNEMICLVYNFHPVHTIQRFFNRAYSWKATAKDLVAVSQALAYAHEKGVIHGFVNPQNIIINDKGTPILFGFEIEIFLIQYYGKKMPGSWINNIGERYLAPEVLLKNIYSFQADIYSFGVLMNEWLTGEYLLVGETPLLTVYLRSNQQKTKRKQKIKEMNPEIQLILQKCLHSEIKNRYKSMQEVSVLLARGALDYDITKEMVVKPLTYKPPKQKPSKILLSGLVLVFMIITFLVGFYYQIYIPEHERLLQESETIIVEQTRIALQSIPSATMTIERFTATPTPTPTEINKTTPTLKPTLEFNKISYPLKDHQKIPIISNGIITSNNAGRLIQYATWGIGDINYAALSKNKKFLGIATSLGVEIFDPEDFSRIVYLDSSTWVSALVFSNNSEYIVIGDDNGVIQLWDTETWQPTGFLSGHHQGIIKLVFSEDDRFLFSLSADETIKIWDLETRAIIYEFSKNTAYVSDMVITPDEHYLITVGKNNKIQFWNLTTKEYVKSIQLSAQISSIIVTPDSKKIIVGCSDHRIYVIDIISDEIIKKLDGLNYEVANLILTENGWIIGGDQFGGVAFWDDQYNLVWKKSRPEGTFTRTNNLSRSHQLIYLENSQTLFSVNWQGITRFLDVGTGDLIIKDIDFYYNPVAIKISHKDKFLAVQNDKKQISIWNLETGVIENRINGELVYGNPFSPNDRYISVKLGDSSVVVYEVNTGKQVYVFGGHSRIETIDYQFEGNILVSGRKEDLHLWSMFNGQEIKVMKNFSTSGCTQIYDLNDSAITFITNYNFIISASTESSSGLCEFKKVSWMRAMDISLDNKLIAVGGNSQLIVHNYAFSSVDTNIDGVNLKKVVGLAIHPDGRIVASALDDNTIRLWNIITREELIILFGHDDVITDLEFTSNGRFLISSSKDGYIKLWGIP